MKRIFIFLLCFYFGSAKIKIKELKVPQSIETGAVDDVILDCDFDAEGENEIVVRWFVNGGLDLVYQWIPATNKTGQATPTFKNNIDVNYKISNDRETMYRALHIINISPKLSGNYTCKVAGDRSEDVATKSMIIYDPADSGLELGLAELESVVICEAAGIFPEPDMKLYVSNDNESDIVFIEDDEITEFTEEGDYNVSSTLYYDPQNLTQSFYYVCELTIPGTTYFLRESKKHYQENEEIETQIEEDFNSLNTSNTTESSLKGLKDSASLRDPPTLIFLLTSILLTGLLRL